MFDDDFLGCMASFNELDQIVDDICSSNISNYIYDRYLTKTEQEYISQAVYNRCGKILNWN